MSDRLRRLLAAAALLLLTGAAAEPGQVGRSAPDFSRPDLAGRPLRLADLRGKLVLLNFWASWCSTCMTEMPRFSAWQAAYGASGLQVIGISMDDDSSPVLALLKRHPVGYPVAMGDAALGEQYGGVLGLPLTYLIGTDGRILARYQGDSDLDALEAKVRRTLPGSRR